MRTTASGASASCSGASMGNWVAIAGWICVLAIPVLALAMVLLTVAVSIGERRVVWYFAPVDESPHAPPPLDPANPYAATQTAQPQVPPPTVASATASAAAKALGFERLGTFRDAKGAN